MILPPVGVIQVVIILALTIMALAAGAAVSCSGPRANGSTSTNAPPSWIVRLLTWLVAMVGIIHRSDVGGLQPQRAPGDHWRTVGGYRRSAPGTSRETLISGVIVPAERRIGVGAEIEIRGFRGFVEEVGPRSVRLRLPDGRRVLLASVDFMAQPVTLHAPAEETDDAEQNE